MGHKMPAYFMNFLGVEEYSASDLMPAHRLSTVPHSAVGLLGIRTAATVVTVTYRFMLTTPRPSEQIFVEVSLVL